MRTALGSCLAHNGFALRSRLGPCSRQLQRDQSRAQWPPKMLLQMPFHSSCVRPPGSCFGGVTVASLFRKRTSDSVSRKLPIAKPNASGHPSAHFHSLSHLCLVPIHSLYRQIHMKF
ncbi:hypothetical protein B0H14DRAFT_3894542 [Mycena olivaceomarginata]|nr:hypothetical protein B0H14DRAFT_3894542 [Mycena olivaceomarginata]